MAVTEKNILMQTKNKNGDIEITYPVSKAVNILGLEEEIAETLGDIGVDEASMGELNQSVDGIKEDVKEVKENLDEHTKDTALHISTEERSKWNTGVETANRAKTTAEEAWNTANQVLETVSDTQGLPSGGTTGQTLVKASNTDYDVKWAVSSSSEVTNGLNEIKNILQPKTVIPGTDNSIVVVNKEYTFTNTYCTIIGSFKFPTNIVKSGESIQVSYKTSVSSGIDSSGTGTQYAMFLFVSTVSDNYQELKVLEPDNVLRIMHAGAYKEFTGNLELVAGQTYYIHCMKQVYYSPDCKCDHFSITYSTTENNNVIKSIQSGTSTSTSVTIGTVNPNKAIVIPKGRVTASNRVTLDSSGSYTVIEFT